MCKYIKIIKEFCAANSLDIYMIGEAVRDEILHKDVSNYDFIVHSNCNKIAMDIARCVNGKYIELNSTAAVEKDECIFKFRNLKGKNINEDLLRCNFTINSIAKNMLTGETIDINGGIQDINNRIIRFVSYDIFNDNPLNMLIAVRLSSQLGFKISEETQKLIKDKADLLVKSSKEDIMDEVFKIFSYKYTYTYIDMLDRLKLLYIIFPVMEKMRKIGKCRYHVVDAYTHSLLTLQFLEDNIQNVYGTVDGGKIREHLQEKIGPYTRLTIVKLGAFLHDIGKPRAMKIIEGNRVSFREHDITGEIEFKIVANDYNMREDYAKIINDIILGHMRALVLFKQGLNDDEMYKLFKEYGNNTIDVLVASLFDIIATTILLIENDEPVTYWGFIMRVIDGYYRFSEIPKNIITGTDIVKFTGVEKTKISQIMDEIGKEIFKGNISIREEAIQYLRKVRL